MGPHTKGCVRITFSVYSCRMQAASLLTAPKMHTGTRILFIDHCYACDGWSGGHLLMRTLGVLIFSKGGHTWSPGRGLAPDEL